MSLERFLRGKLVVLPPSASVYEAARAMSENGIGAVLVGEHHHLAGMVTDRDLGLRLIERDLDPREATLQEVMTSPAVTCDVGADVGDVLTAMASTACRRVPILRDGKPVGLITLDDLVLEWAVDLAALRAVVAAQLQQPARLKAAGATHPGRRNPRGAEQAIARHRARADRAYHRLLRAVRRQAPRSEGEHAERALHIVLPLLCQRIRPEDARRFVAQLPSKLGFDIHARLVGPRRAVGVDTIETELQSRLGVTPAVATVLLESVCRALADELSPGALGLLKSHLPAPLKVLFQLDGVREAV